MTERPLIELRGVSKRFGAVQALREVNFEAYAGEVVGLVGDNGAGKSTLVKTLAGINSPDEGQILWEGRPVELGSPRAAAALGIATVYQDLALADNLDVVENLFIGREVTRGGFVDDVAMEAQARELLSTLSVRIPDLREEVGAMSGGQRQSVAIARTLMGQPRLVLLDEPTAALGVEQTEQVLRLVARLRERGLAVVVISHNLADVFRMADRVFVLRLGREGGEFETSEAHPDDVVAAITGAHAATDVAAQGAGR